MYFAQIPAAFYDLENRHTDWAYYAEPSSTGSLSMKTGVFWPRGKMLGGTSGLNGMLYVRGNRRDYDFWKELGNPTWDWDSVLKYFKKSEDNRMENIAADTKHHGVGGYLKVDSFKSEEPMTNVMFNMLKELGFKHITDCNGEENIGYLALQGTLDHGTRCSSAKAFLIPAKNRKNLHVIKNAQVTKLNIDDEGSVIGATFFLPKHDRILSATARKETILSAGALNSPQLLMISGIGPKAHLAEFNIKVRQDLPVGQNLQDHLIVPYIMAFHKSNPKQLSPAKIADAMYEYLMHRRGFLASTGVTDFSWFLNTENNSKYPNIQYHAFFLTKQNPNTELLFRTYGYKNEITDSIVKANENAEILIWLITLLTPKSVGRIELRSGDPFDTPKIHHNYFKEKKDLDTIVGAIRELRKLSDTQACKDNEGELIQLSVGDCDSLTFDSDQYWECYSRHMTSTIYHPVGTAKMGPATDKSSVVDSQLKVHNVNGLRVVDASIMPKIISGNTNAPTIMIGEKAADFIKDYWTTRKEREEL